MGWVNIHWSPAFSAPADFVKEYEAYFPGEKTDDEVRE